ncbi:hypothetical protein HDV05_000403 [Chytridiales sp. JEL 0842]|nr:hypothetical protein HDV05_000403 [Chytridiales sp. JEL 0842]
MPLLSAILLLLPICLTLTHVLIIPLLTFPTWSLYLTQSKDPDFDLLLHAPNLVQTIHSLCSRLNALMPWLVLKVRGKWRFRFRTMVLDYISNDLHRVFQALVIATFLNTLSILLLPLLPFYKTHLVPLLLPVFKPSLSATTTSKARLRLATSHLSENLPVRLGGYTLLVLFVYLTLSVGVKHFRRLWLMWMDVGVDQVQDEARDGRFAGVGRSLASANSDDDDEEEENGDGGKTAEQRKEEEREVRAKRAMGRTGEGTLKVSGVFGFDDIRNSEALEAEMDADGPTRRRKVPGVRDLDDLMGFGLKHGAFGSKDGVERFSGKGRRLGDS